MKQGKVLYNLVYGLKLKKGTTNMIKSVGLKIILF